MVCVKPEDFMQISRRFHAEWVAESQRNLSGSVAESYKNRPGNVMESFWILAQAWPNLSRLYLGWSPFNLKISGRFLAHFTQNGSRNLSGVSA